MRPNILTTEEVAAWMQLTPTYIRRLARANRIPCFKVGKTYRYWQDRVQDWINAGMPSQAEQPSLFEQQG